MNIQAQRLMNAVKKIQAKDLNPYLQLREWLHEKNERNDFEVLFRKYYGLNAGGLTEAWKSRYFELLFSIDVATVADLYTGILKDLYNYKRRKGDMVLQFSFASKLVAIHDESKPLYDKHISDFLGLKPPDLGSNEFRIIGFLNTLKTIQRTYSDWLWDQIFIDVLNEFNSKYPQLADCHPGRRFDFLVWAVGHYKIS